MVVVVVVESWLENQLRVAMAEAWGQFGKPEEGYVHHWKPLSEDR
jgi:hypothetical protein